MNRLRLAALSFCLCLAAQLAGAQSYTSIVVFGDSLSDTGNVAHLTASQYAGLRIPGAPLYTDGRFTDGTDTVPAATAHTGVWIEQLAAMLPAHPAIANSLDGGTDYAYGYASTDVGTSSLDLTTGVSVNVNNIGQQVTDYLAAHPAVPAGTLVVLWGGSNDLNVLAGSIGTAPPDLPTLQAEIVAIANREVALAQRLIAAGATDLLVPNLPPLGAIPRFNANPTLAGYATLGASTFNTALKNGLDGLAAANPGVTLHLFQLDTFSLFNMVIGPPPANGLVNVTVKSQGQVTANPDQYLFWDDVHPTTTGHALIAAAAEALLAPAPIATSTAITSGSLTSNLNSAVTFTITVTATAGNPPGSVTILDGSATLGTGPLTPAGSNTAIATFSTPALAAGPHTITATYAGGSGFAASTSSSITQTVVAPAITVSAAPTTITVAAGSTGTSMLTVTPAGGFNGTVTFACQNVPANAFCNAGGLPQMFSAPQTFTLTIVTDGKAPAQPAGLLSFAASGPGGGLIGLLVCLSLGLLHLARRRAPQLRPGLLKLVLAMSAAMTLGLSGCGGSSNHNTAKGTYAIPVVVTPSTGSPVTVNITLVVQ